jgi:dTDP-4-dehydrorhamnose reductase
MSFEGPILVTGASGQVGGAIERLARARGLTIWAPTRAELDLTQEGDIVAAAGRARWAAVINCAAYTAVDKAESEPELAHAVNAHAPAIWAREAAQAGIPLIHVSTDYVFDGSKSTPYAETDPVNPLGVYGRSKEAGEAAIRAAHPNHAIIRTAWVVSAGGANFINTMLRLGAERPEVRVVDDQLGCPSSADDIAGALLKVAATLGARSGTWHFVNGGEASWHGLAAHVFAETKRRGLPTPMLTPITTADYPTPAQRPANSRLLTAAIERDFDIQPRPWQEAMNAILAERLS